jgi:hypothetical protein
MPPQTRRAPGAMTADEIAAVQALGRLPVFDRSSDIEEAALETGVFRETSRQGMLRVLASTGRRGRRIGRLDGA